MLRAIFRTLSLVCFAVALVAAVLDVTRSVADSAVVMTPLHADWIRLAPESLAGFQAFVVGSVHPFLWDPVVTSILKAPTWIIFSVLALLFAMMTRRRRRRWQENFGA